MSFEGSGRIRRPATVDGASADALARRMTLAQITATQATQLMITIYHNTRCSKSRATCNLIVETLNVFGEPVRIVEYLKHPPTVEDLKELHRMLGGSVRDMIRDNEPIYEELGLEATGLTDAALYEAIAQHPILLQRPIVTRNGRAVIGRPPEAVRALFE
jgi:arsenate reductase